MLRKTLTILALLALVAAIPAVAFAGNGNSDAGFGQHRAQLQVDPANGGNGFGQTVQAQLQVDPANCDGEGFGYGYGPADGEELAPQPQDGTGYGAVAHQSDDTWSPGRGNAGTAGTVGPMDGTGIYHEDGAPVAPRDGTGLRIGAGQRGPNR